ncbi:envelope stress response membrane protein PspB [Rhodospirillum rubrum]|uniref:Phage shock B n=1 Tax=Rhodospirillum rubrum (strain ATCC 11170 / ATH 1.1.1 / DSM 467 / LMG 4362 / NCIMB 8255 / S1) TaxID=269796 RepID=Q2RV27_RHORT|nr:envelope stress response membrane protein PspB [Rhodospirillum rubrum]ABC22018.1 Phage shock B [Rhodospirillum rubrum ATCC 11170]AEO47730.1 phage shock protein B [Rhodospirillum rubrum F11]MBK1666022.1 envelope stress response membrane protein PspB [Rhodospirillum rubrum]MBK1678117.1 envelope stress response membrane protein PspB [Rhodospirillum rubrum]QXG81673.1 envelope stress response membrane protein PspB [Rhodospirillum rubrum]
MSLFVFLFVPLIVFVAVVMPTWIIFHYVTKWKRMRMVDAGGDSVVVDQKEIRQLRETAHKLNDRILILESILDAESPNWRNQ